MSERTLFHIFVNSNMTARSYRASSPIKEVFAAVRECAVALST